MNIKKNITNGVLLVIIGIMHTRFALSADVFGKQFHVFSQSHFYKISRGMEELPIVAGRTNLEGFAAFWFFYFGVMIIPLGLLVHSIERKHNILPHSFTLSYLVIVLIGSYMIPNSGITLIMLPQAIYMVVSNFIKARKRKVQTSTF